MGVLPFPQSSCVDCALPIWTKSLKVYPSGMSWYSYEVRTLRCTPYSWNIVVTMYVSRSAPSLYRGRLVGSGPAHSSDRSIPMCEIQILIYILL